MSLALEERLIKKQHDIWTEMQAIMAEQEKNGPTDATRGKYDELDVELLSVTEDISRVQGFAERGKIDFRQVADNGTPGEDAKDEKRDRREEAQAAYRDAFFTYARKGMSNLSRGQQELLEQNFEQFGPEARALAEGTDSAGGYLVPDDTSGALRERIVSYGGLVDLATKIVTATGNSLQWPTADDTANMGAILGENTQIGEQDTTFGTAGLGAYTYTSKLVRVSWQLLNDSVFDLESYLAKIMGERLGRILALHSISGTGSSQPTGLVTATTASVTGTGTTAISYDNLIDLEHSIDPAYRNGARYVFGDATFKSLRKLKDADGRPIWQPVPAPGFPSTINGNPYTIVLGMAAPGASAKTILFGNIAEAYLVRFVKSTQMVVLRERYADFLQSGFFAYLRADMMVQNQYAVSAFAHAAS